MEDRRVNENRVREVAQAMQADAPDVDPDTTIIVVPAGQSPVSGQHRLQQMLNESREASERH